MTRGEKPQLKVHFKGKDDDFLVFVDDEQALKKWKAGDTSVPLTQVIGSFQVFITHRHGAQGTYDEASNATLDNEFGTHVKEDVIKMILQKGQLQESEMTARQGSTNDSRGSLGGH